MLVRAYDQARGSILMGGNTFIIMYGIMLHSKQLRVCFKFSEWLLLHRMVYDAAAAAAAGEMRVLFIKHTRFIPEISVLLLA